MVKNKAIGCWAKGGSLISYTSRDAHNAYRHEASTPLRRARSTVCHAHTPVSHILTTIWTQTDEQHIFLLIFANIKICQEVYKCAEGFLFVLVHFMEDFMDLLGRICLRITKPSQMVPSFNLLVHLSCACDKIFGTDFLPWTFSHWSFLFVQVPRSCLDTHAATLTTIAFWGPGVITSTLCTGSTI